MALRVGLIGLGFMGRMHFGAYEELKEGNVVAACDVDAKKRRGDWGGAGNIEGGSGKQDMTGIRTYSTIDAILADDEIDVVDVALPTSLHAEATIKALRAGKHVICEKPMARTSAECRRMIAAAKKAKKHLYIGQCIRFWPAYVKAAEIIKSRKYGRVAAASFTRLSAMPTWSYKNWLLDAKQSGGTALDLHIHDADFVQYVFGKPKSVTCSGSGLKAGRLDHVVATYDYGKNMLVMAEGGWDHQPTFPFTMTFRITMPKATLTFDGEELTLHPIKGQPKLIKTDPTDGYRIELKRFLQSIATNKRSKVVTPESAMQSVQLIEAEMRSAATGKPVTIKY